MAEFTAFVVCIALFALYAICFYYERKEKNKKEHDEWIYFSEKRLRRISDEFERACFDATEDTFEKYVWNVYVYEWHYTIEKHCAQLLSDHERIIETLKKDYIENLAEKYSDGYRILDGVPAYLIEEYNQRINDISRRYHHINFTMKMRIRTLSPEYRKNSEIEVN